MVEDGLELVILLFLPCECLDYKCALLRLFLLLVFLAWLLDKFEWPMAADFVSKLGSSRCQQVKSVNAKGFQTVIAEWMIVSGGRTSRHPPQTMKPTLSISVALQRLKSSGCVRHVHLPECVQGSGGSVWKIGGFTGPTLFLPGLPCVVTCILPAWLLPQFLFQEPLCCLLSLWMGLKTLWQPGMMWHTMWHEGGLVASC